MKINNNEKQRRVVFTQDAKLAIRRTPAVTMAARTSAAPVDDQTESAVTLSGYAITWNTLSDDRGGYRVRLVPGSAKFTPAVHALFHHDFRAILGATGNGTLRITPDDVGVKVEIDLPDTYCAADVAELVEDKYVTGMSFSMLLDDNYASESITEGGIDIEQVTSFLCDEVTVTAIPAFTYTSIGVQSDSDDESDDEPVAPFARIEQSIRLDRLRLETLEI